MMNKRCLALTTMCVIGIAIAPLRFNSAFAHEPILVDDLSFIKTNPPDKKCSVQGFRFSIPGLQTNLQVGPFLTENGVITDVIFFNPPEFLDRIEGVFNLTEPLATGLPEASSGQPVMTITGSAHPNRVSAGFDANLIMLTGHAVNVATEPNRPDLSKQYLELSNQLTALKLKRMHPQLLALEVETLKKEISDQEAALKLEEAQEQLKKILNEHPESPAALSAKRMLEGVVVPVFSAQPAPSYVPGNQPSAPVTQLPTY